MLDTIVKTAPSRSQCCNCGGPVGDKSKTQAFFVDDDTWCPCCFFNVRARKEPNRWHGVAVECRSCTWKSFQVNFDPREVLRCPKCGSTQCRIPVAPAVLQQALES